MGLSAITYNGEEFLIEGHTEWSGSVYDEDPELVKTFKSCGIPINWNVLLSDDPIQQILNAVNGTRLFDIETKVFEPTGGYSEFLSGYVMYKGYSSHSFTYTDDSTMKVVTRGTGTDGNIQNDQPQSSENDYIIPDSSNRYLTEQDLVGLSNEELRRARNEIAARHGRRFKDADLQAYFDSKSWYNGTIDADDFNKVVRLSEIEQKNMEFIKKHER